VMTGAALALLCAAPSLAITFAPGSKPDPFADGKTCDAPQLASYGDYVRGWSSKYDLIFSPQDYPMWIWRCDVSGYVSFPREFGQFNEAEKARIAAYLKQANFGPKLKDERGGVSEALLQHLEKIYALRDQDDLFRAYLLRYFAWQYRAKPAADEYRKKAFDLYLKLLNANALKDGDLLEGLYVLGFYSYKLGRIDDAKKYFDRLKAVETIDPKTKEVRRGAPYLEDLGKEILAGKADDKVRFANDTN
jgi:tetratricopeptide (TPR) repeat protein